MPNIENNELNINIETDLEKELITLNFVSDDQHIAVGFNIQEAQLLAIILSETVTAMLIEKMQLFPSLPENIH